jgi:Tol biopolymer transport system component
MNVGTRIVGPLLCAVALACGPATIPDALQDPPPGRGAGGGAGSGDATDKPTTPPRDEEREDGKLPSPGAAACNRNAPFGALRPALGLPPTQHLATPRLSADERTIYFTMHVGGVAKLGRAERPTPGGAFGPVEELSTLSSSAKDNDPSVSADGATIWFSSERDGSGARLYFATRSAAGTFGDASVVDAVRGNGDEQHPYFRSAGKELWFSSSRAGQWDIYRAQKAGVGFSPPKRVDELATDAPTRQPMIAEDGLTIVLASERSGGKGKRDLWMARRTSTALPFGPPQAIAEVNSSANEFGGWLSNDGCRLYFSSDREEENRHRIYVAERPE